MQRDMPAANRVTKHCVKLSDKGLDEMDAPLGKSATL